MTDTVRRKPSWREARSLAVDTGRRHALPAAVTPLAGCLGRLSARELVADAPIPHYDSAAMDGWVVSGAGPWTIVPAPGDGSSLSDGCASPIVTGALVPDGASAVLRSESAVVRDGILSSARPAEPQPGQHIRRAGCEALSGEVLIEAGRTLNPAHIALAASAGADSLSIHPTPLVDLLLTGDEVATSGRPSPGRVRDGFGVQLPGLLTMLGGEAGRVRRVPDDLETTIAALAATDARLVVTTGGTGGSSADHLRAALRNLGAAFVIDGVAMRPGGPTCLAEFDGGRLVLALPGNPLAAMVALITLGGPLLAALSGRPEQALETVESTGVEGRAGTTLIVPQRSHDGMAVPTGWDGSAMMRGLASADGLLIVPGDGIRPGGQALSVPLPWR